MGASLFANAMRLKPAQGTLIGTESQRMSMRRLFYLSSVTSPPNRHFRLRLLAPSFVVSPSSLYVPYHHVVSTYFNAWYLLWAVNIFTSSFLPGSKLPSRNSSPNWTRTVPAKSALGSWRWRLKQKPRRPSTKRHCRPSLLSSIRTRTANLVWKSSRHCFNLSGEATNVCYNTRAPYYILFYCYYCCSSIPCVCVINQLCIFLYNQCMILLRRGSMKQFKE